ncbi:voltage-gated hydrogen channel 1-like isoform X2 [Vombatus ursinus]|uniref:voltage-gated hydrogen channel 1-like isoform X2 n=1 Tax=Vombatus ursinus TaxID=29139 RepID=UPI000FFD609E|nr:voltage-gated hydrogen channel 1-like isoform X2 [Vombatus ursinus]
MPTARATASVAPGTQSSTTIVPGEVVTPPEVPPTFRTVLRRHFISNRFQVFIVSLVVMDAMLVLVELMLDFKIIQPDKDNHAGKVFHCLSIAILTFFMIEIVVKLYVFHKEFFSHKCEILDVVVVIVSFALDIAVLFCGHEFDAFGLLILLRLWRVARIMNRTRN